MKHAARIEAEKKHAAALAALKLAENGRDEAAFLAAHEAYKASVAALCQIEQAFPTRREVVRRENERRLSNMGLMA